MNTAPIVHDRFTIERFYEASAAEVFEAWSDPSLKARWFIGPPGWREVRRELDFRIGGEEVLEGRFDNGQTRFVARYYEIVADARIAYVYDMQLNGRHHSLSLATVELIPTRGATKLVFTEQVAFFDGTAGSAPREHGTAEHLDRIAAVLRR
ncbi:MAG TPA: SRPBCC family protein [Rudaea sp.]